MPKIKDETKIKRYIELNNMSSFYTDDMITNTTLRYYKKGELLASDDTPISAFHFIVEGTAKVYILTSNGKSLLLRFYRPVNVLGDLELMIKTHYTANVEAITDCYCLTLPLTYVNQVCINQVPFLQFVNQTLAKKLFSISHKSTHNIHYPLKDRFCSYLLAHMNSDSSIKLINSYSDIADLLGTSYRHLSRTVKELVEDGIIRKKDSHIVVTNITKLKELASDIYIDEL